MKNSLFLKIMAGVLALGVFGVTQAVPISSCTFNAANAKSTCNLFESDANGNASETSSPAPLRLVNQGWIVINEMGTADANKTDPSTWSELLLFVTGSVSMFSENEGAAFLPLNVGDVNVTAANVVNGMFGGNNIGVAYKLENTDPFTFMRANAAGNMDTITVNSDVPEPASLALLALGLGLLRSFKNKESRSTKR